jgi:hypothetical protein
MPPSLDITVDARVAAHHHGGLAHRHRAEQDGLAGRIGREGDDPVEDQLPVGCRGRQERCEGGGGRKLQRGENGFEHRVFPPAWYRRRARLSCRETDRLAVVEADLHALAGTDLHAHPRSREGGHLPRRRDTCVAR